MPPHMVSLAFIVNVDVSSLYVPEKVLLATKSAILIKLLFYVEHDNIEFCIYQSITNIVFCHDKSIRFVRI